MTFSRLLTAAVAAFCGLAWAQAPNAPVAPRAALNLETLPRPAVPADPLEIVTTAQAVENAQQRLDAIASLRKAQTLSNLRAQPYSMKTEFVALGGLASDGNWVLENISPGPRLYRWTVQGPNYSAVRLFPDGTDGMLYGNQPSDFMPLRLAQVREALFGVYPAPGPQASIRTATGSLNGQEQRCVLIAMGAGNRTFSGGRNWEESEYCMDAATGLLTTYSPAAGLYVHYDYSSALNFHGKTIPAGFTITQAGRTVVEARNAVSEPPDAKDPMFTTAGLSALGVGQGMGLIGPRAVIRMPAAVPGRPFPRTNEEAVVQVVSLHANVSQDNGLSELEILASTDAGLNDAALQQAKAMRLGALQSQPGTTEQSGHAVFTIEFLTRAQ
jgi:hypothetical protein